MEKEKEVGIMQILSVQGRRHAGFSERVRRDQAMILNKEITKSMWDNYFTKEYNEKELINNFFSGIKGSYIVFINSLGNQERESELIESNSHPLFNDLQDRVKFYADDLDGRKSSSEDHNPVISSNKVRVGTTQFKIEEHLINNGIVNAFTPEGIQAFAYERGIFLTMDNAKRIVKSVNEFMEREAKSHHSRFMGEDLITQTALKEIQKKLIADGVGFSESNEVGSNVRKKIQNQEIWLGKIIADVELNRDNPKKLEKSYRKLIKRVFGESIEGFVKPLVEVPTFIDNKFGEKNEVQKR